MPSRRITMCKIKEVLRLRYACGLSLEQIARAQNLSKGVVAKYLKRAAAAGIDGTTAQALDEADLAQRLKPSNDTPRQSSFTAPDFASIHGPRPAPQALKHKSVTLQLLWEDYRDQCPDRAYRYTSFCVQYRLFAKALKRSMRQVHRAGETGWPRAIDKQLLAGAVDLAHGALQMLCKRARLDPEAGVAVGAAGTLVAVVLPQ